MNRCQKVYRSILCAVLSSCLMISSVGVSYAEELQVGAIETLEAADNYAAKLEAEKLAEEAQLKLEKEWADKLAKLNKAKTSAKQYISKYYTKYKLSLTKIQKSKLKTLKSKISITSNIEKIKAYKKSASKVFTKAKKLHKAKQKFIKQTKSRYAKYKSILPADYKKSISSILKSAEKAKSYSVVTKLKNRRDLILYRAKLGQYVDTRGWSKAKLDYVSSWGKRDNKFLSGTPMANTGYLIAAAAYAHNMDPRLAPAIASVESDCGQAPYGSKYNVWGWIWNPPAMYSWEDSINKWHSYFSSYFAGESYPISSMHGYGGYGPWYVNQVMAKI